VLPLVSVQHASVLLCVPDSKACSTTAAFSNMQCCFASQLAPQARLPLLLACSFPALAAFPVTLPLAPAASPGLPAATALNTHPLCGGGSQCQQRHRREALLEEGEAGVVLAEVWRMGGYQAKGPGKKD
jgi:hypothetical protein